MIYKLNKNKTTVAVVYSDIHAPHHHKPTMDIALQIVKDVKPDIVGYIGDCFDAEGISKYTAKTFQSGVAETLNDIEAFKEIHAEIVKASPKAKRFYCGDNHCTKRIKDTNNKLLSKGEVEASKKFMADMDLGKHFPGVDFNEYNEFHRIGRLSFTHGEYHSDASAKAHALAYPHDVMYGHIHTCQHYVLRQKSEYPKQAISIGSMCNHQPGYMNNQAHGWVHAFAVIYFRPDGHYNAYTVQVHKRTCIFNGKLYTSKAK